MLGLLVWLTPGKAGVYGNVISGYIQGSATAKARQHTPSKELNIT